MYPNTDQTPTARRQTPIKNPPLVGKHLSNTHQGLNGARRWSAFGPDWSIVLITVGKAENRRIEIYTGTMGDVDKRHEFWTKKGQQSPNTYNKSAFCFVKKAAINLSTYVYHIVSKSSTAFCSHILHLCLSFPYSVWKPLSWAPCFSNTGLFEI